MKIKKLSQFIGGALLVMPFVSFATPIELSDFSGSETLINFSGGYSISGNVVTTSGATFTSNNGNFEINNWDCCFANIPGASLGLALNDRAGDTDILFDVGTTVNRLGLLLSTSPVTTWTLSAFANDNSLIESVSASMPGFRDSVFLGLESNLEISYFTITEAGGGDGYIPMVIEI